MFRRSAAVLVTALLSSALIAAAPPADPTALLRDAVAAYSTYSYSGQVQNTDFGTNHTEAVLFRIEHRAPDMTRRWYLAPEPLFGDSIISHGDASYDIDQHNHRIIFTKDDALDDQVAEDDNFGLLLHNYRATMGPDEDVAGRSALTVLLVNKYTGQTTMRISLDKQTKLVLQKERYSPSGAVAEQMRFEQISYTKAFPAALFSVPSAGYTTIQGTFHGLPSNDLRAVVKTAGFEARGPQYLPDGFLPIAGDVSDIKGTRTLHLLYSDGLRSVSLFQNARGAPLDASHYTVRPAKVGPHDAKYLEDGSMTLVAWAADGLHFELVGELSREEMLHIAASVAP
ncbi:MAG TPA: sigma-E factor regulatory protein RseB domain-containing protein [Candidatus Baltobacteraceae bacterium]|jgi:negative regulator of sigma E activity|nr:sigma-E factor regulatory protein RseB domain-containing protein [Candidatus Baltobacteraceae bacterium]